MIYESTNLYLLVLLAHFALFLIVPVILFRKGRPVLASIVMMASTLLPIAGQACFTDSDMPGSGFLLLVEAPIALLVFIAGVAVSITQLCSRLNGGFRTLN